MKEVSDVMEVHRSGEDDVTQYDDWVKLEASMASVDFDAYVPVDQKLATCGVLCMEEMCGVVGSGSCVEEGQGDDDKAVFYRSSSCVGVNESIHVCS
jgi:hypothetical protein